MKGGREVAACKATFGSNAPSRFWGHPVATGTSGGIRHGHFSPISDMKASQRQGRCSDPKGRPARSNPVPPCSVPNNGGYGVSAEQGGAIIHRRITMHPAERARMPLYGVLWQDAGQG